MGASASSIPSEFIYVSYDIHHKNAYLVLDVITHLGKLGYHVISSKDHDSAKEFRFDLTNEEITNAIHSAKYVIICVSQNTVRSPIQNIEINHAWNKYVEFLYLMMDKDYTPETNTEIKSIVKKRDWNSCYDKCSKEIAISKTAGILGKPNDQKQTIST
jgi:hypothetical protein